MGWRLTLSLIVSVVVGGAVENYTSSSVTAFARQLLPNSDLFEWLLHTIVFVLSAGGSLALLRFIFKGKGGHSA